MPVPTTTMAPKRLWKRAAAAVKDRCSILCVRARHRHFLGGRVPVNGHLAAAVIKATSHDEAWIDYKNAGRIFSWARTSPSLTLAPLMWMLSRRVQRTRSWAVALKGLMVAHGLLLCGKDVQALRSVGQHLPFDLSSFQDRSSESGNSWGLTAFVRAYFSFLNCRTAFLKAAADTDGGRRAEEEEMELLIRLERLQDLLELLMQIRPYGDGMEMPLILEAMDCVVIEVLDVYSSICDGVACALVEIFGGPNDDDDERRKGVEAVKGRKGIRILRRAVEQSSQLSSYFEICKGLGVPNARDLPVVDTIPEEDIQQLERMVMGEEQADWEESSSCDADLLVVEAMNGGGSEASTEDHHSRRVWTTFEDDHNSLSGSNPFLCSLLEMQSSDALTAGTAIDCYRSKAVPAMIQWEDRDLLAS